MTFCTEVVKMKGEYIVLKKEKWYVNRCRMFVLFKEDWIYIILNYQLRHRTKISGITIVITSTSKDGGIS